MGNTVSDIMDTLNPQVEESSDEQETLEETDEDYHFMNTLEDTSDNGLFFNDFYLPEEVVTLILSHVDAKELLKCSLVCRKWFNIIRSSFLWCEKYERCHRRKPKKVPWYVYYALFGRKFFDQNLLKNGNGQQKFKHWRIVRNFGDSFIVEKKPVGADPLPLDVEDFKGHKSCFATSYYECDKLQEIRLSPFFRQVINTYKPHIYVSEWTAGRFDCGCTYMLSCKLFGKEHPIILSDPEYRDVFRPGWLTSKEVRKDVAQWEGRAWSKVELLMDDYPDDIWSIVFQHVGQDTQFWKGHYGSKMAGGVVKVLFDTIRDAEEENNHMKEEMTTDQEMDE